MSISRGRELKMNKKSHKTNRSFLALVLILTFCASLMLAPGLVMAEDRSFDMRQIWIEAELLPDASMQVTEMYTIDFSGQWNGFYRYIPQGDSPVKDVVVSEKGQPYEFNPGTDYGPPGTYLVKQEGDNLVIDWSIDAYDETRTFTVSYRVINAVKVHKDVAEFYRQFVGDENEQEIEAVSIALKLPEGAKGYEKEKDIRIWGHGPLNGEVKFGEDADQVAWTVNGLPAHTFLESRVTMPTALFPKAPKSVLTRTTALPEVLKEEEEWADKANRQRKLAKAEVGGAFAFPVGALAAVFLLWRKFGRKHPVTFDGDYYRELPASYSPAELSLLWDKGKIEARDITATILDLARRKFLRIDQEMVEEKKLFRIKKEETYRITFLEPPQAEALRKPEDAVLRAHEKELLDYLRKKVAGGKDHFYLEELEEYAEDNSEKFYEFWQEWTTGLSVRGDELNFFDSNSGMQVKTVLLGVLLLFGGGIMMATWMPILGVGILIAGMIILFIPLTFKRRSVSGEEDFVRWKAFRRFLQDFSEMDKHEIPSLVIWEHYLVYAVTLGVAKEVIKQLELVFPNMQDGDYVFGHGWYYYGAHSNFGAFHNSLNGINNSFEHAVKTVVAANSKSSSGSGGGGGFTGGGGGGGGGGGFGGR